MQSAVQNLTKKRERLQKLICILKVCAYYVSFVLIMYNTIISIDKFNLGYTDELINDYMYVYNIHGELILALEKKLNGSLANGQSP